MTDPFGLAPPLVVGGGAGVTLGVGGAIGNGGSVNNDAAIALDNYVKGKVSDLSLIWNMLNVLHNGLNKDNASDRSIPQPKKPNCGCTCNCRADANDNIPGNIKPSDKTFAFGTATAGNCAEASKQAKRNATRTLGKQPKHVGCRCSGK